MKYLISAAALVTAALVRAADTNVTSSFIPTNVTSQCQTFLEKLDSDTTLSSCVTSLVNATASFSPTSTANLTTSDINYTLASLCQSESGCDEASVRSWLSDFYSACTSELTSSTGYNSDVRELYDILYVFTPLRGAVCAIDSANQDYCVNEIRAAESAANSTSTSNSTSSANSTSSSTSASASASASNNTLLVSFAALADDIASPVAFAAQYLVNVVSSSPLSRRFISLMQRDAVETSSLATIVTPNATTYQSTNLPFLFLQPDMSSAALCTPCSREIFVAYIAWEAKMPYALGLSASPILGGQSKLWSAVSSTCGSTFVSAITSEAGVYSSSSSTSSAFPRIAAVPATAAIVFAGAIALLA